MPSDADRDPRAAPGAANVLVVTPSPHGDEWCSVRDPAAIHQHLDRLILQDGQGHRACAPSAATRTCRSSARSSRGPRRAAAASTRCTRALA